MDPTNNNPANGFGSGGESPAGAGVPSNAGTVNPPAANVASQSSSSTSTGAPSVGPRMSSTPNMTGTRGTGAFAPGAYRPMSARPMNSGMMPAAQMPIASGTGDIVLSKDTGGSKSKKWWIIGGAIGAVLVVALVVLAIINNGGFGGPKATDLRSAFNIYANYFLTGEAKDEDVAEASSEEEVVEEVEDTEIETEEAIVEEGLEVAVVDEESEEEGEDDNDDSSTSYFEEYLNGEVEGDDAYLSNLNEYFDSFYNYYVDEMGEYEFAIDYIDNYKSELDLLISYYEAESFDLQTLANEYVSGGEEAAEGYIETVVSSYENVANKEDFDFQDEISIYANRNLELIKEYDEAGCLIGGEIDYDCAEEKELSDGDDMTYVLRAGDIMNRVENNIYTGIYYLRNISYDEASEFLEDDNYKNGSEDENDATE